MIAPVGEPAVRECRTMDEVREEIDRLGRQLVDLLAERSGYVDQAARIKTEEDQIRDVPRIDHVITKVRRHSAAVGLDADLPERIRRGTIECFIAHENTEHRRIQRREAG